MEELIKVLILIAFTITFGSISIALSVIVAFIGLDKELQKIASAYNKGNTNENKDDKGEVSKNV
ncbi:hypothetical protein SAMN06265182_1242 [Persephonella hydrogeniphila]|uniref:Uncharacterized protein n=1 Tax=Persephonella hydrogeniphila TaxID=198703 RepID=A0A285NK59_9AQUI|nr:hypothetical protein [Persephonella hydrogeniphila]SNZ08266.1 hypothetical protein SAMN06265182_1242 [Persephonella hydrogeniphila]